MQDQCHSFHRREARLPLGFARVADLARPVEQHRRLDSDRRASHGDPSAHEHAGVLVYLCCSSSWLSSCFHFGLANLLSACALFLNLAAVVTPDLSWPRRLLRGCTSTPTPNLRKSAQNAANASAGSSTRLCMQSCRKLMTRHPSMQVLPGCL